MTSTPSAASRRLSFGLAAVVGACLLGVLGLYAPLLRAPLLDGDDPLWVDNAAIGRWIDLVWRRHFIGWRPVTALTFVIGSLARPAVVHAVDLSIFTALLCAAWRVARGALGLAPGFALAVVLGLGLHPVFEEVLCAASSRGDLLAALFGCLYLGSVLEATPVWRRLAWLALGLLSKENAFALLPAAALHAWWVARGSAGARLKSALVRSGPDWLLAALLLVLRQVVLQDLGGYSRPILGRPLWIPADYWLGVFAPHAPFFRERSVAFLGAVLAGLAFAWLALALRRASAAQVLLLMALFGEISLYLATRICFFRLLPLGVTIACLWLGERAARGRSFALAALCFGLVWSALHLGSSPWLRIERRARIVEQTLDEIAGAARSGPVHRLYVFDLPATYVRESLERRPALFYGNRATALVPSASWYDVKGSLVNPVMLGRLSTLWNKDSGLSVIPWFLVQQDRLEPRARAQVRSASRQRLEVDFDLSGASAGFAWPDLVAGFEVSADAMRFRAGGMEQRGRPRVWIDGNLLDLPAEVEVRFFTTDGSPARFR